ncbi:MAG: type II toxin-antitoxin system VapC family toxin [Acidobacteriota bacterium]
MKTAIDSSVLLDVFTEGEHVGRSQEALRLALRRGALIVCDVVWAEVRAHFKEDGGFERAMRLLSLRRPDGNSAKDGSTHAESL